MFYSFLPTTRKSMWLTPHAASIGVWYASNNQQVYHKIPPSPTDQQVSSWITISLLSLGSKNRHVHALMVSSPWLSGSHPTVPAASYRNKPHFLSNLPCSINSSFFSPWYESGNYFLTHVHRPQHKVCDFYLKTRNKKWNVPLKAFVY